jgi:4-hydroxythreonine-4-phosphate dehydrogenase
MKTKNNLKKSKLPKIILTIGDPNGIGPEIILKIFNDKNFISKYDLKIAGSKKIMDHYSSLLKYK